MVQSESRVDGGRQCEFLRPMKGDRPAINPKGMAGR
jgi:hypothetical protein